MTLQPQASERMGLRRQALSKGAHLLSSASALAARNDYGALSQHLSRAEDKAHRYNAQLHQHEMRNDASTSSSAYDIENLAYTPRQPSEMPSRPGMAPQRKSSFGPVRGYFSAAVREERNAALYTEERVIAFPGYAVLRESQGKTMVEVEVSGFAFRTRPLTQANRTQKLFVRMAKQLAGLKALPTRRDSTDSLPDETLLAGSSADFDPKAATFSQLLALANLPPNATEEEVENAIRKLQLTEEPEDVTPANGTPGGTPLEEMPPELRLESATIKLPQTRRRSSTLDSVTGLPRQLAPAGLTRRRTSSMIGDNQSIHSESTQGSATAQLVADPDLISLHSNLSERVCLFNQTL